MAEKILLVEDDPDIQMITTMALQAASFEVTACSSGPEAIGRIAAVSPDIVLMDVMMPEMDGVETLRVLKQQNLLGRAKVIFMTAKTQERDRERIQNEGVYGFIAKPYDPMTL